MVDFTYPYDAMMSVTRSCSGLTILDHHATAQAALEPLLKKDKVQGRFDMTKSIAILAWERFNFDTDPPKLLLHIKNRDLVNYIALETILSPDKGLHF